MSDEQSTAAAEGIIDAAFNQKDVQAARAFLAPEYVEHRFMPGQPDSDFWGYAVGTLRVAVSRLPLHHLPHHHGR